MLTNMLSYSTQMLSAIATFLSSEPMIYIFGLLAIALVFKIIFNIIGKA